MTMTIRPAILCGGSGTRLWPLSRSNYPKQLLRLTGDNSLLQETALRFTDSGRFLPPYVICNDAYRFLIRDQLHRCGVQPAATILEPAGRNTAPAATIAALLAMRDDPEALLLLCPSDHLIADPGAFRAAIDRAASAAREGRLMTFGIAPTRAETGFGYIESGGAIDGADGCFEIRRFTEKPDRATAERYLAADGMWWNSGIFLMRPADLIGELERHAPDIVSACRAALDAAYEDIGFLRLGDSEFAKSPSISIDYAVMEKTERAGVVPCEIGWNDLGSWQAVGDLTEPDTDGNVLAGDAVAHRSRGLHVHNAGGPLVVASGVDDILVVSTKDAVLVADRTTETALSEVVGLLASQGREEASAHPRTHRPWGWYETVDEGPGFKVKRIAVAPGEKLSLQKHNHRAEHWVVVRGTATVTRGGDVMALHANESTYIPVGTEHRLENESDQELQLIEVQTGEILTEEDIVRLEDVYGRDRPRRR